MSHNEQVIENPLYAGMSLRELLESANLFDFAWRDLKGAEGKSGGSKEGEEKKDGEWEQYNAGAAFLGPTLWDKTLSYDSDLKVSLEYMDLDEFLNENGIPIEETTKGNVSRTPASAPTSNNSVGAGGRGGASIGTSGGNGGDLGSTVMSPSDINTPQSPPPTAEALVGSGMGVVPQMPQSAQPQNAPPQMTVCPPALSPDDYVDGYSSPDSSVGPHSPSLQVHEPEKVRASLGRDLERLNNRKHLENTSMPSSDVPVVGEKYAPVIDYDVSPNDLALATVPGQDFDPRTRIFTEDELKPQPMIKKSRKQFVPVELKDEKYWARRRKNNLAAKRSRDARRLKENQIAMRANFLEKENSALSAELQKAQSLVEALKKRLSLYEAV